MNKFKSKILYSSIFSGDSIVSRGLRKIAFYALGNIKSVKGKKNVINNRSIMLNSSIRIVGNANKVEIEEYGVIKNIHLEIRGNNNRIVIGKETNLIATEIGCRDDGSLIQIGEYCNIGSSSLSSMEGKQLIIGDKALISYGVEIRTSDGHSIFDNQGNRINIAKNVTIGENVWIGQKCFIFKGADIPNGSVIGAGTFINKKLEGENSVFVGTPVRRLYSDVNWSKDREVCMKPILK